MHVILGSEFHQCRHCEESFLYSDSTIDAGLILTTFGIVSALFTFAFDIFFTKIARMPRALHGDECDGIRFKKLVKPPSPDAPTFGRRDSLRVPLSASTKC